MNAQNPVREMDGWLSGPNMDGLSGRQVALLGFGLGYHPIVFLAKSGRETRLLCIEKDLDLLALACHYVDLSPLWDNPRFQIAVMADPSHQYPALAALLHPPTVMANGFSALIFPPFGKLFPDYVARMKRELDLAHLLVGSNRCTRAFEARAQGLNTLANAPALLGSPGVARLFGRFSDLPAVVVAAGPSLRKNMHLLGDYRDRVVIIAVDTAYRILAREGIHADLVVALDFTELNYKHFDGLVPSPQAFLVVEPQVDPRIPPVFPTQRFFFRAGANEELGRYPNGVGGWLMQATEDKGFLTGISTTSISCLHLGMKLGCKPIALVGQDLAFTGGRQYAPGAMQEEAGLTAQRAPATRRVPAVGGGEVETSHLFYFFKANLEGFIREHGVEIVNATEGGARIEGTREEPLGRFLSQHAAQTPAGIYERLCALHHGPPAGDASGVGRRMAAMADEVEAMARLAREGHARVYAAADFATEGRRVADALFSRAQALTLAVPLLGLALDRFHDQDLEVARCSDAEERLALNRRRYLDLLSGIEAGAVEMAAAMRAAAGKITSS